MNILEELVLVANELDSKKWKREASDLDTVITRLAGGNVSGEEDDWWAAHPTALDNPYKIDDTHARMFPPDPNYVDPIDAALNRHRNRQKAPTTDYHNLMEGLNPDNDILSDTNSSPTFDKRDWHGLMEGLNPDRDNFDDTEEDMYSTGHPRLSQVAPVDPLTHALQQNRPTTPPPVDYQAIIDASRARTHTQAPEPTTGPIKPFNPDDPKANDDPNGYNGVYGDGYNLTGLVDQKPAKIQPMPQMPLQYNTDPSYAPIQRAPVEQDY